MLHRLCGSPSIPLSFILANVLPRWNTYCVCCGTEELCSPTPSIHRLRRGLPGYLILFAPHAFEPQRQSSSSKPPSPLVFLLISTHFTATLRNSTLPLRHSSPTVSNAVPGLSPGFHIRLAVPPALPLHPVNPDNACTIRITAAAGTYLAGASYVRYRHFFFPADRALHTEILLRSRGVAASGFPPLCNIPHCCLP